jgi:putative nucleotidyltransferase with HDIG domain
MSVITQKDLIRKVGDLKVLPFVARKVLDTISNDNLSFSDLANIIEKDQTIAARVLKVSNSALYGLRQEVNSIQQALLILGLKTIRSLVLSLSTKSLYKKFGMTEQKMWDHSVATATAARIISATLGSEVSDIAFIGGLMHDLGKVILNNETPELFTEVMMRTYNEGISSVEAEQELYGYDHAVIGASVSEKWGFPDMIREIIEKHHLNTVKLEDIEDAVTAKGIACVNLSDYISKVLGIGYREPDESIVLSELPSAVFLKFNKEKLNSFVEEIKETYDNEKAIFQ